MIFHVLGYVHMTEATRSLLIENEFPVEEGLSCFLPKQNS